MTVAALTIKTLDCQSFQTAHSQAQSNRSAGVSFGPELMAESENLELKRRAAPEGSEKRARRGDSRCLEGNRRVNGNSQFINQIGVCENQRLQIDTLGIPGAVLSQIGAAVPGLTIVMDHFAGKPTTFDVEDAWKAEMQAAATYVGLNIKASDVHKLSSQAVTGKPAGLTQFQPIADPKRYAPTLEFLWKTFGADRLIFGTNWPVSDAGGIFVDSIDLEIEILESFLTEQFSEGRDKVMYKNALRVYSPRK